MYKPPQLSAIEAAIAGMVHFAREESRLLGADVWLVP